MSPRSTESGCSILPMCCEARNGMRAVRLSEQAGEQALSLLGFGRALTPLLRHGRTLRHHHRGRRFLFPGRECQSLLKRTDQDVAFAESLAEAADQLHL